jgi:DNA-binding transcriptional MerR regulator
MSNQLLRIGRLAAQTGVSPRTVDYYTALGLLTPSARTEGNFRLYPPEAAERIITIRNLETHGFSLEDISTALRAPADLLATLDRLDQSLKALHTAVNTVNPDTQRLLAVVAARADGLLLAALELAAVLPPSPT